MSKLTCARYREILDKIEKQFGKETRVVFKSAQPVGAFRLVNSAGGQYVEVS